MRDRLGRVIYVGKAKDLHKRLSSYFIPSRKYKADRKTRALIESVWDFEVHEVRNEAESFLLEGKLIKDYRPKYNVSFRDDKRFYLAKIHLEEPFPSFSLTRVRKEDGARYFGPFPHSTALKSTLNWINKEYGLRACRPLKPGEEDYKHCHDDIIKNCSAPCVGKITEQDYRAKALEACQFLEGHEKETLVKLRADMEKAAARQDFEKAAGLRDLLENLDATLKPMRQFRAGQGAPLGSNINPQEDLAELADALRLQAPPQLMECFDISNISNTYSVASMVRFREGVSDNNANYRRYRIKTVTGQDDFASMAEVVKRRYSRILLEAKHAMDSGQQEGEHSEYSDLGNWEMMKRLEKDKQDSGFIRLPDLVIVDGGKGQLSAACKQLQRLGLHDMPIIGLAKKHEEIYRPNSAEPLLLSHDTGAIKLLQRIRDEAHRFANSYHQLLLKRRVEESILDDCPGVSEKRKEGLIKHFGSVARMRKCSVEELAVFPGISLKLAEQIHSFLKSHQRQKEKN